MNHTDGYSDGETETAIAAAAYAISSLEEKEGSRRQKQRRSVEISGASLPKTKSKIEDSKIKLTSFRGSFKRLFTDQEEKDNGKSSGNKRVEGGKDTRLGPKAPPVTRMPTSPFVNRNQDEYSTEPSKAAEKAAAWEKAQMIKIKNRYEKMMAMILEWENEKKEKARSRLEKKHNEPEERRARALQTYEDEISRIEKVAGEARALTEEKKRNDEAKSRAKAEKIRSTGRMPRTCGCF